MASHNSPRQECGSTACNAQYYNPPRQEGRRMHDLSQSCGLTLPGPIYHDTSTILARNCAAYCGLTLFGPIYHDVEPKKPGIALFAAA